VEDQEAGASGAPRLEGEEQEQFERSIQLSEGS